MRDLNGHSMPQGPVFFRTGGPPKPFGPEPLPRNAYKTKAVIELKKIATGIEWAIGNNPGDAEPYKRADLGEDCLFFGEGVHLRRHDELFGPDEDVVPGDDVPQWEDDSAMAGREGRIFSRVRFRGLAVSNFPRLCEGRA